MAGVGGSEKDRAAFETSGGPVVEGCLSDGSIAENCQILSPAPGANRQELPAACTLRVLSGLRMLAPDARRDQQDRERPRSALRELPQPVLAVRRHAIREGGRGSAEGRSVNSP